MRREILRACRALRGITQKQMAERIGICEAGYCRIERGYREPTLREQGKIHEILGPTMDQISTITGNGLNR
jgi:transcriptional regulator with XRE-family HTH domain